MRRQISTATWDQIKTAYASGIGLRELARNAGIPAGTVLARAKRERWTQQIQSAKTIVPPMQSNAITPMQSVAITMQQRGERYTERMAGVSEKVLPHLESMEPGAILENAREIELNDRWSRRNFGLNDDKPVGGVINLAIMTDRAAFQVISNPPS